MTQLGLSGQKMFAASLRQRLDDRQFYPLWQTAEDLQVPVLIQFGILSGAGGVGPSSDPPTLHDVARGFPGVTSTVFPRGLARQSVEDQLRAAWSVGIKGEELKQIFAGNIRRLLNRVK